MIGRHPITDVLLNDWHEVPVRHMLLAGSEQVNPAVTRSRLTVVS